MNGKMTAFSRGSLDIPPREKFVRGITGLGYTRKSALAAYFSLRSDEIWLNDQYQVNVDKSPHHSFGENSTLWHLSIKRLDKNPIHDWRDLQEIKNQLCGKDAEAIELYPKDSRVIDTANQFHLWVFMRLNGLDKPTIGIGWTAGQKDDRGLNGSKQRAFEKETT